MFDLALDLLAPPCCVACGADAEGAWCEDCTRALPKWLWPRSPAPRWVESAWTWAPYDGPGGAAIRRAKYGGEERAMAAISARLCLAAAGRLPRVDRIVPVPQAWTRTLKRGYAPTSLLARDLSRALERPLCHALRRRPGLAQAGLDDEARARNVADVFSGRVDLRGQRVLLVDDVITTGATASAAAAELLNQGAARVHVLAACDARG